MPEQSGYYVKNSSAFEFAFSKNAMHPNLAPRKTPVQDRSNATVLAIFEATIQVLLKVGYAKLTTTLVSERAGVSVGTLYQYFPHKDALLTAVIVRYIEAIGAQVREACQRLHGRSLQEMVDALVAALVEAKTRRIDVTLALNGPKAALNGGQHVARELARTSQSVQSMLSTCTDHRFLDLPSTADVLLAAVLGAIQAQMEHAPPTTPQARAGLERQLRALAGGYLRTIAAARGPT